MNIAFIVTTSIVGLLTVIFIGLWIFSLLKTTESNHISHKVFNIAKYLYVLIIIVMFILSHFLTEYEYDPFGELEFITDENINHGTYKLVRLFGLIVFLNMFSIFIGRIISKIGEKSGDKLILTTVLFMIYILMIITLLFLMHFFSQRQRIIRNTPADTTNDSGKSQRLTARRAEMEDELYT